jgi:GntR family transcriptional regulator / MocR family aminotransferase
LQEFSGTTMKAGFPVENIQLDRDAGANLDRQLYRRLRELIERRVLPSGSALPSTRLFARDLGIGRNTVIAAYEQLALEGYITVSRGTPPSVSALPAHRPAAKPVESSGRASLSARGRMLGSLPFHHGSPGITAFHPGLPDASHFPFNTWSKLLTRRTKLAGADLFGSYFVNGYPPLCEAIARYLAASRGVDCRPEQVVITNGAQSAFDLLARLLTDPGDHVWMEEPGYYGAGAALLAAGAQLMPLHVEDDGWNFQTPPSLPRLIFVTPSCHHPLGLTMTMEQRLNLVRMAHEWNAWIVEDDYDSEYRFQGQPIPALHGIADPSRVVFVGTFAKILFPAMRLGYMVVPMDLRETLTAALSATGQFAPLITQAALADFISEGHLTRHLRRMRRIYAERRQFFIEQFDRHLGRWMVLRPTDSGIQLIGLFRAPTDDRPIAAAARRQGINVSPLSMQFRHRPPTPGLLMGFAASDLRGTEKAARRLASILAGSG